MADLLLGIDIGTSACKAAVFTLDGQVAAQCSEEYEVFYPQPGWAEQNPDDWSFFSARLCLPANYP